METLIIDLSEPTQKRMLLDSLRSRDGVWRIDVYRFRLRRSDAQNALLWAGINQPFADFLREQGDNYTAADAHEILKFKFLRESIVNKSTGEVIGERVRSTATLNTTEFSEYIEKCVAWLAEMFGIICHLPGDMEFEHA